MSKNKQQIPEEVIILDPKNNDNPQESKDNLSIEGKTKELSTNIKRSWELNLRQRIVKHPIAEGIFSEAGVITVGLSGSIIIMLMIVFGVGAIMFSESVIAITSLVVGATTFMTLISHWVGACLCDREKEKIKQIEKIDQGHMVINTKEMLKLATLLSKEGSQEVKFTLSKDKTTMTPRNGDDKITIL